MSLLALSVIFTCVSHPNTLAVTSPLTMITTLTKITHKRLVTDAGNQPVLPPIACLSLPLSLRKSSSSSLSHSTSSAHSYSPPLSPSTTDALALTKERLGADAGDAIWQGQRRDA